MFRPYTMHRAASLQLHCRLCKPGTCRLKMLSLGIQLCPLLFSLAAAAGHTAYQQQASVNERSAALQKLVDLQAADEIVTTRCACWLARSRCCSPLCLHGLPVQQRVAAGHTAALPWASTDVQDLVSHSTSTHLKHVCVAGWQLQTWMAWPALSRRSHVRWPGPRPASRS